MSISSDLISQFVKTTNGTDKKQEETIFYGTIVKQEKTNFVKLDGSEILTPVSSTTVVKNGERVTVIIKNHSAIVTGNITSPSAQNGDLNKLSSKITDFEIVIADKVSTTEFDAVTGRIDTLVSDNVTIKDSLTVNSAAIKTLSADNVTIKASLTANEAKFNSIETHKLSVTDANIKFATIENLKTTDLNVHNLTGDYGDFKKLTTDNFIANDATIKNIEATKLNVTDADIKYANIDFSNIGKTTMESFYANSGLIQNVVIGEATISGKLVGVTISGNLIEGDTIVANKLVIKGSDGLYYKLNTDGMTTELEQTDQNSLNGQIIRAKSVTASKIDVSDLVAFNATIGGFKITNNSIYSGVKESADNTTRGVYLDSTGQISLGDSNNFMKYFKDADGTYKLSIAANQITFGTTNKSIEKALDEIKEEVSTLITVESTRGILFKNSEIATVLLATVYHGKKVISEIKTLKAVFGNNAFLQWRIKKNGELDFTPIPQNDPRIGSDGFSFTTGSKDFTLKGIFDCILDY